MVNAFIQRIRGARLCSANQAATHNVPAYSPNYLGLIGELVSKRPSTLTACAKKRVIGKACSRHVCCAQHNVWAASPSGAIHCQRQSAVAGWREH